MSSPTLSYLTFHLMSTTVFAGIMIYRKFTISSILQYISLSIIAIALVAVILHSIETMHPTLAWTIGCGIVATSIILSTITLQTSIIKQEDTTKFIDQDILLSTI